MKQYKCHRVVHAEKAYDGYLVVYDKGTEDEYQVRLSKEEFEKDYFEISDFNFGDPDDCIACGA